MTDEELKGASEIVKTCLNHLEGHLTGLRTDISALRTENTSLRTDVQALRTDMSWVKRFVWWFLGLLIVGIAVPIMLQMLKP